MMQMAPGVGIVIARCDERAENLHLILDCILKRSAMRRVIVPHKHMTAIGLGACKAVNII